MFKSRTLKSRTLKPTTLKSASFKPATPNSARFQATTPILATLAAFLFATIALAQAPEAPGKPLPPGPMQPKVKAACLQCHNASRITEAHFSRMQWSDELDKMAGLGAVVSDADRNPMLDYLTTNFGPQKGAKKTPNDSTAK